MNAKNFYEFLQRAYIKHGYVLSFESEPIYKGIIYRIKVDNTQIGIYTEFSDEIGGSKCYEGFIIGYINHSNHGSYVCLLYSKKSSGESGEKKRLDYHLGIPFP